MSSQDDANVSGRAPAPVPEDAIWTRKRFRYPVPPRPLQPLYSLSSTPRKISDSHHWSRRLSRARRRGNGKRRGQRKEMKAPQSIRGCPTDCRRGVEDCIVHSFADMWLKFLSCHLKQRRAGASMITRRDSRNLPLGVSKARLGEAERIPLSSVTRLARKNVPQEVERNTGFAVHPLEFLRSACTHMSVRNGARVSFPGRKTLGALWKKRTRSTKATW